MTLRSKGIAALWARPHAVHMLLNRNARMLEGLADFTRYLIVGRQLGAFATVAVNVLPPPPKLRFGGRQASIVK